MTSTKATDSIITGVWAALKARGITSADGVRIVVERTGGSCEALTVTFPGHVVVITDGDAQQPVGDSEDVAVLVTTEQWAGDDDGYERILPDTDPATIADTVAALMGQSSK